MTNEKCKMYKYYNFCGSKCFNKRLYIHIQNILFKKNHKRFVPLLFQIANIV